MPRKGDASITLPKALLDRIKNVQKDMGVKINPTRYIKSCVEYELTIDEASIVAMSEHEAKVSALWDEIVKELNEKGETKLVEKLEQYLFLEADTPD